MLSHSSAQPDGPSRILWIEDDEMVRRWGIIVLERGGFDVRAVDSGAAGIALACREPYDLIVLDWALPDISGGEVLRTLRSVGVQTVVMVLTGRLPDGGSEEALRAGASVVERKPVKAQDWVHAIRVLLRDSGVEEHRALHWTAQAPKLNWKSEARRRLEELSSLSGAKALEASERLQAWLAGQLACGNLGIPDFLLGCRVLEASMRSTVPELLQVIIGQLFSRGLAHRRTTHAVVLKAIAKFEDPKIDLLRIREEEMARELGVDAAHLGRLLFQETQMGFRAWRLGARLRMAVRELVTTREQVAQIAFRSGWTSLSHFDRAFRWSLGLNPSHFRRIATGPGPQQEGL